MLTDRQLALLKTELQTDPRAMGYGPYINRHDDAGVMSLLTSLTSGGAGMVAVGLTDKGEFMLSIIPAVAALEHVSTALQLKWDRILNFIGAAPGSITVSDPRVQMLLGAAVQDGILTADQVFNISFRLGSRIEVVLGAGVQPSMSDLSFVLRGTR